MKSTAKLFYGLTVFMFTATVVYALSTAFLQDTGNVINENHGRLEWAGVTGLLLGTLMTLMVGGYLHFTELRSDITPADFEEAEIVDGTGTLGFFSASSIWPFVMTMGILLMGYGIAFMAYWLILLGAAILVFAGTRLNTQYLVPPEKH
ncbi:cytochrome c oxidase subunit 4 [Corynebacterium sp. TAE3-ERU12]|uniref:aa3-type cytochrome oxidase subunit IV n=1 Tax=Corynebacterium sp. TAE3-ERU12 TaxID=2849491 RepID=UPI001C45E206|nr:cytochrome c oxidase subunit 4 [Corynebacterium sp. TAE3-ERU12]MBV7296258.1 cytochrome c oxidase subunit 4 [Corynebacterium sp. TAE3-ERU12]